MTYTDKNAKIGLVHLTSSYNIMFSKVKKYKLKHIFFLILHYSINQNIPPIFYTNVYKINNME